MVARRQAQKKNRSFLGQSLCKSVNVPLMFLPPIVPTSQPNDSLNEAKTGFELKELKPPSTEQIDISNKAPPIKIDFLQRKNLLSLDFSSNVDSLLITDMKPSTKSLKIPESKSFCLDKDTDIIHPLKVKWLSLRFDYSPLDDSEKPLDKNEDIFSETDLENKNSIGNVLDKKFSPTNKNVSVMNSDENKSIDNEDILKKERIEENGHVDGEESSSITNVEKKKRYLQALGTGSSLGKSVLHIEEELDGADHSKEFGKNIKVTKKRMRAKFSLKRQQTTDSKDSPTEAANKEKKKKSKIREYKATLIVGLIMAAFILSWLPFFVLYVLKAVCHSSLCNSMSSGFTAAFWLGYSNSALNPIIYTVFNKHFRGAFKKIICR